uniref:ferritin family protein n=1 Tax=Thiohalocapsa sp. TaxID=2497641 RepID=UPI0025D2840B
MNEGEASAYERIKSKQTLKEILEVATSFEQSARDFYTGLIPKVGKNIRWVVEDLAKEEQHHYDLFSELAARPDLEQQVDALTERPVTDGTFADAVMVPDLGEEPADKAILQFALGSEHLARHHSSALDDRTAPRPTRPLVDYLAQ